MSRLLSRSRKRTDQEQAREPVAEERQGSSGGRLRKALLGLGVLGIAYVVRRRRKSGDTESSGTGQQSYGTTETGTSVDVSTEEVDERETAGMETEGERGTAPEIGDTGTAADREEPTGEGGQRDEETVEDEGFGSEGATTDEDADENEI